MNKLAQRDAAQDLLLEGEISFLFGMFRKNAAALFQYLNAWDHSRIDELLVRIRKISNYSDHELREQNRFLTWDQINKMKKLVEFGSHTRSHLSLNSVERTELIRSEIIESKKDIETNIDNRVLAFSYPAGYYSDNVKTIVKECDYSFAVSQDKGIDNLRDKFALKRINLWEGTTTGPCGQFSECLFALALSGF
jgi:peptidoglycan/xylan/chitin deacetylase (PgdA/CDA1 family)